MPTQSGSTLKPDHECQVTWKLLNATMTETIETSGRKQDAHLLIHLVKYESNKAHTAMGIKTASKRGRLKSRVLYKISREPKQNPTETQG